MDVKEIKSSILHSGDLGEVLTEMRLLAGNQPQLITGELLRRMVDIGSDYELMCDFMLRGYADNQREELYRKLLRKAYRLACDWEMRMYAVQAGHPAAGESPLHSDDVKRMLEEYVAELGIGNLQLEEEPLHMGGQSEEDLRARHLKDINAVFESIVYSFQWTQGDEDFYRSLLLSPTIDINDARMLVSAVMLAAMMEPDHHKLNALAAIYSMADDEELRQRALVGVAFAMPQGLDMLFPEYQLIGKRLMDEEKCRKEMLELQMQVFLCMNAEKDNERIQRDIMPGLMKNQNFRITRFGIEEKEKDTLEDILHPDAEDKAMEELEANVDKMLDMQKNGADIYFGGFSHMKRYSFFYTLCNWFVPFYPEHPGLSQAVKKLSGSKLLDILFMNAPLCDSDKYSFALAVASVIDKVPANMRELLELQGGLGPTVENAERQSGAFIRRSYLQDLFRFFRLYPQKTNFPSPFDYQHHPERFFMGNPLILSSEEMDETTMKLSRFLLKHNLLSPLMTVLDNHENWDDADYCMMEGFVALKCENYYDAQSKLERSLEMRPGNKQVTKALAQAAFHNGDFDVAEKCYRSLLEMEPGHMGYELNMAIAQVNNDQRAEGLQTLYKLHFEDEGNLNVLRGLAWGQMLEGNLEQAEKLYGKLLQAGHDEDCLNAGYCAWLFGKTQEAVDLFRRYLKLRKGDRKQLLADFANDARLLRLFAKSDVEQRIMADIVCN